MGQPNSLGAPVSPAVCDTSDPTLTDGNQARLSITTAGRLRTVADIGTLGSPLRNQQVGTADVNVAQIAATTIASGNGTASAGCQRVTVASNNTAIPTKDIGSAFTTGQVSIGTSATQILAANSNRMRLVIINNGTTDVFIGGSGVTTSNGQMLTGTKGYPVAIKATAAVYGVVDSGSQTVSYHEETL